MNREQLLAMDPSILLSIINMKLRDCFSTLEHLCDDYDLTVDEIMSKLNAIGYVYKSSTNQFISEQV
jgi:hypothetical protein